MLIIEQVSTSALKSIFIQMVRFLHSIAKTNQYGARLTYRFITMQDLLTNFDIN